MIGPIEDRHDEITARVANNLHTTADVWVTSAVDSAIEYVLIKTERVDVGLEDNELTVNGLVGFSERLYLDAFSPNGVNVSVADPAFEPIFQPEHLWKHWRHYFEVRKIAWGIA